MGGKEVCEKSIRGAGSSEGEKGICEEISLVSWVCYHPIWASKQRDPFEEFAHCPAIEFPYVCLRGFNEYVCSPVLFC